MLNTDPNLVYRVQVTGDLTQQTDTWHTVGVFTSTSSNSNYVVSETANGNTTELTVRDDTAITPTSQRFIRVQVIGY
jgi:hypothetical protein